jgi:hypothetical protein
MNDLRSKELALFRASQAQYCAWLIISPVFPATKLFPTGIIQLER